MCGEHHGWSELPLGNPLTCPEGPSRTASIFHSLLDKHGFSLKARGSGYSAHIVSMVHSVTYAHSSPQTQGLCWHREVRTPWWVHGNLGQAEPPVTLGHAHSGARQLRVEWWTKYPAPFQQSSKLLVAQINEGVKFTYEFQAVLYLNSHKPRKKLG